MMETKANAFDWSPQLQGSVLSCFFWTYPFFQIPSGYIANRFGGRYPIIFSFFITAVITALGPTFAHISPYLFIASRAVMGIFQAAIFPGLFVVIMKWMPLNERSMGMAINEIGIHISANTVISFTSGFLIKKFTWTAMFYFPATAALITVFVTAVLLRNTPEEHFLITDEEIAYIKRKNGESGKESELELECFDGKRLRGGQQ